MLGTRIIAILGCSAMLIGCVTAEGEDTVSWSNLPGDTGVIRGDLSRSYHDALTTAAQRLPLIDTLSCGSFRIALRANPEAASSVSNIAKINQQGGRGELFDGYFLTIQLPTNFDDRIRFRKLIFPDLNANIFLRQGSEWRDVTNPEPTILPPMEPDLYRDLYPSYDPSLNGDAFFDRIFITEQPWAPFHQRSIFWNNGSPTPPSGRYRVSFTTPYEIEWPSGSCKFTLPDMEFEY